MIKFIIVILNTLVESFWQRQLQSARDLIISPHSSRVRFAACCFFFELWLFSLSATLLLTEVDRPCCTYRVTVETPSTNFVLNSTLALLNIPSFRETTMNCKRNKSILINSLFISMLNAKCTYLTGKINSLFHVINACNCSVNQQYSVTCECLKWDLIIWPMFWVCDISRAASTSSRMYRGAGLNNSMARIRDRAISDLHTKQNNPWLHNGIIYNIIMNFSNLQ